MSILLHLDQNGFSAALVSDDEIVSEHLVPEDVVELSSRLFTQTKEWYAGLDRQPVACFSTVWKYKTSIR